MARLPSYVVVTADNLTENMSRDVLRVDMDGGLAKQRPRYSRALCTTGVTLMIESHADKAAFDQWWHTDIGGGAGWFDFYDAARQTMRQVRIVGGAIDWSFLGNGVWSASVKLEGLV